MDPITVTTAALGAIQAGLSLTKDLAEMNEEQQVKAGTHTLAMLLLETEINLALLETVPKSKKKGVALEDARYFAYADQLELDVLGTFLSQYELFETHFNAKGIGGFLQPSWKKELADLSEQEVLGVARYLYVRGMALKKMKVTESEIRKGINVRVRLTNLRQYFFVLSQILRELKPLKALTQPKKAKSTGEILA